jgi:hypothetical protein
MLRAMLVNRPAGERRMGSPPNRGRSARRERGRRRRRSLSYRPLMPCRRARRPVRLDSPRSLVDLDRRREGRARSRCLVDLVSRAGRGRGALSNVRRAGRCVQVPNLVFKKLLVLVDHLQGTAAPSTRSELTQIIQYSSHRRLAVARLFAATAADQAWPLFAAPLTLSCSLPMSQMRSSRLFCPSISVARPDQRALSSSSVDSMELVHRCSACPSRCASAPICPRPH